MCFERIERSGEVSRPISYVINETFPTPGEQCIQGPVTFAGTNDLDQRHGRVLAYLQIDALQWIKHSLSRSVAKPSQKRERRLRLCDRQAEVVKRQAILIGKGRRRHRISRDCAV